MALFKARGKPSLRFRLQTLSLVKLLKMTDVKLRKVSKLIRVHWIFKLEPMIEQEIIIIGQTRLSISKKKAMLTITAIAIVVEGVAEETRYELMSSSSMKEVETTWTMIHKRL